MIIGRFLAGLALALACLAGPAFSETPPADAKPSPDVAWLVIGVQPENMRMEIDEARIRHGEVFSFHYNMNAYRPVDGFIVVKAKPDVVYAVAASSMMFGKSIFGVRYKPCGKVSTFHAAAGKVVYFTTLIYRGAGARPQVGGVELFEGSTYSQDLEGARAFLKAHHPGLADSLEQGAHEVLPFPLRCR